jgi:hypothetical protein
MTIRLILNQKSQYRQGFWIRIRNPSVFALASYAGQVGAAGPKISGYLVPHEKYAFAKPKTWAANKNLGDSALTGRWVGMEG